jgi:hypothetical protein
LGGRYQGLAVHTLDIAVRQDFFGFVVDAKQTELKAGTAGIEGENVHGVLRNAEAPGLERPG